jgi:hypothetical protein
MAYLLSSVRFQFETVDVYNLYSLSRSTGPFSKREGELPSKYAPDMSRVNCLSKQITYNGIKISAGTLISSWDEADEIKKYHALDRRIKAGAKIWISVMKV